MLRQVFGGVPAGLQKLPGPARRFPLGNGLDFLLRPPWAVTAEFSERYGSVALAWLGPFPMVMLHDPDLIRQVLVEGDPAQRVYKAEPVGALAPASPTNTSSFVANGVEHARMRRGGMATHPGYKVFLDDFTRRTVDLARDRAKGDLAKRGRGFERRMQRFMFDVISHAVVGENLGNASYRHAMVVFRTLDFRMRTNLPVVSPLFYWARRQWWGAFRARVAAEREGRGTGAGLLKHTFRGSHVSIDQYAIGLSNVFPGGLFSTTSVVLNALVALDRHPAVAAEVRAAIREDHARGGTLDFARLAAIAPFERLARETLRLYTPVPIFMRRVGREPLTLKEHRLDPGTMVAIGPGPLHRSKAQWDKPEDFNPARWTPELMAERPYGSDWFFPFGRGPRECEGRDLALASFRAVLYGLLLEHEVRFEGAGPVRQKFFFAVMTPSRLSGTVRPTS